MRHRRPFAVLIVVLGLALPAAVRPTLRAQSAPSFEIVAARTVPVPARDGVMLGTDI